jgi:hypothetical protein
MKRMTDFYEIWPIDIGRLYFIPDDLSYFIEHFVCKSMSESWSPPPVKVVRRRAKPADFSSWAHSAPIVRERVCPMLIAMSGSDIEILPFYKTVGGEMLFAVNVLTTDNSKPIFKPSPMDAVCVHREFGVLAREKRFTGLALADPFVDNLAKITRRESVNVFPGLLADSSI